MTATIFIITLFACLLLGFPIFISLIMSSSYYLLSNLNLPAWMTVQPVIAGMNKYSLLCIPFFVLAATIMGKGKIGEKLLNLSRCLVGHFYGGIALTGIFTCTLVGAMSGAATAGILIVGPLIYKEMTDNGYGKAFSAGLITSASAVAILIPPSITFVIYAINTNTSIARLFLSGIGAGLLYSAVFGGYSYVYARRRKLPLSKRPTFKEILTSIKDSLWAIGLPVVVLGGIYSGLFSPTEAAGVSAIYAIIVEMFIYKDINLKGLYKAAVASAKTVAIIYILLGAGKMLAYTMTIAKIPDVLMGLLGSTSLYPVLGIINITFLIAGMFVGPGSAIVVLTPLFLPLALRVGINPIHLGTIIITNLAIGMFTAPFGLNLFVACGVLKIEFSALAKAMVPFILLSLITLVVVSLVPALSLWLPHVLMP